MIKIFLMLVFVISQSWLIESASAHHVLGRPAYSLNEDSNTPPSMQVETQIGSYFVTYMVFPAFPKANEPGRVNVYATRIDDGVAFDGSMEFSVRDDAWFSTEEEKLGVQRIDDGVYRQGFQFSSDGDYIITARFESDGEPYIIDFPMTIGDTSSSLPVVLMIGGIVLLLATVNIINRKKLLRTKIRSAHGGFSR